MRYIAVDGPTGVGKSTTARAIAERLGLSTLMDPVSASPLLDDYYEGYDSPEASLRAEHRFLDLRAGLLPLRSDTASDELFVSDFVLARTGPFSEFLERPGHRLAMREALDAELAIRRPPVALVLLTVSPSTLLERVRRRDRDAEETLDIDHLEALVAHFAAWHDRIVDGIDHVIEIDTDGWDPRDPDDLDDVIGRLPTG